MSLRRQTRQAALLTVIQEVGGQTELAEMIGTPKTHISAMASGKRGVGDELAARIERKTGKPAGWMDAQHWTPVQHSPAGAGTVALAHALRQVVADDELPILEWEFILAVPASDLPKRFRAAMPDDALAPDTPRGLVLHFSTEAPPTIGHGVLVQDAAGGRHVRRYAQGLGGAWRAEARNSAYMTLHSGDGVQLLAVVTGRDSGEV